MPLKFGFKTTGVERLSKKLRDFAKSSPNVAAEAVKRAADKTLVLAFQEAMINQKKKYGKFKHNWKKSIYNNISARVVQGNQKYPSVVVGFDEQSPEYIHNFLEGGMHGDWPLERMTRWIADKDGITNIANARRRADRIIRWLTGENQGIARRSARAAEMATEAAVGGLDRRGQVSYREVLLLPLLKELKSGTIAHYDEFRAMYREELKQVTASIFHPSLESVPF